MEFLLKEFGSFMHMSPPAALAASFIWGILSVLLSPCHLASIPLLIAFLSGQEEMPGRKKAFLLSVSFAGAMMLIIAVLGFLSAAAGRLAGDCGAWTSYLSAALFAGAGLYMLEVIKFNFKSFQPEKSGGAFIAAFLLGLTAGLALGPCTFAFMAPVLAVSFRAGAESGVFYGMILLLAYGVGHCAVIVGAGVSAEAVQKYLDFSGRTPLLQTSKKILGIALILIALWIVYNAS